MFVHARPKAGTPLPSPLLANRLKVRRPQRFRECDAAVAGVHTVRLDAVDSRRGGSGFCVVVDDDGAAISADASSGSWV